MYDTINEGIRAAGWDFTAEKLTLDGERHELKTENFKGQYVGSVEDGRASLTAWDWRSGDKRSFSTDMGGLTKKQREELAARHAANRVKLDAARRALQDEIAERAHKQWGKWAGVSKEHPYLTKKGLGPVVHDGPFAPKVVTDASKQLSLIIPMHDTEGKLWGYQAIDEMGGKVFLDGQKVEGAFHLVGKLDPNGVVYIVEGYATGATISQCAGKTTAVAFNARNLPTVASALRRAYPNCRLVLCGDNDQWRRSPRTGAIDNVGLRASREGARASQGSVCMVRFDHLDPRRREEEKPTDFNDLYVLSGAAEVKKQLAAHYETHPLEYIATEHTGFHSVGVKGGWVAEVQDLVDYFSRHHTYRYIGESKTLYEWDGKIYKEVSDAALDVFAQEHFRTPDGEAKHICDVKRAQEFRTAVKRQKLTPLEWFNDSTQGFMNFQNGVLGLGNGELLPHSPDRGFRGVLTYDFDATATCPAFDSMLGRVTCGNTALERLILEYMGYCLSNDAIWRHAALICVGTGANGKSTLLKVIRKLCGDDNVSSISMAELSNPNNRIRLDGKLCNINEENSQKRIDSEIFKAVIAGDRIGAKKLYKDAYEFNNRAKFVLAFNEFDRSPDGTEGFSRRLLIAPFDAEFKEGDAGFDPHIDGKLEKELPGVFNRARAAYGQVTERGRFTVVDVVEEARAELKLASNPVEMFFEEHCAVVNGEFKGLGKGEVPSWAGVKDGEPIAWMPDMYVDFVRWCDANGYRYPIASPGFSKKICRVVRELGAKSVTVKPERRSVDKVQRAIRGVTWLGFEEF